MKRTIFNSEGELVQFLRTQMMSKISFGIEEVENCLGIEFAYVDGTYATDRMNEAEINDDWDWEDMDLNFHVYRRKDSCNLPNSYPVLLLYNFDSDYDRMGKMTTCMFDFVTKDDVKELLNNP